ncbi:hypothetical protein E5288_WYG010299 [Bos mutus]|uniref:Uncharacterized protein n=1 Tax=Bos mutus TaxID=72004 RepID=A0A6B0R7W7_9CETA|nr:hypothetical protein [Bos mutus]
MEDLVPSSKLRLEKEGGMSFREFHLHTSSASAAFPSGTLVGMGHYANAWVASAAEYLAFLAAVVPMNYYRIDAEALTLKAPILDQHGRGRKILNSLKLYGEIWHLHKGQYH